MKTSSRKQLSRGNCVSFCVLLISELPSHVASLNSRPKATGWAPVIQRRVLWATTSVAPTSLTSAWGTAARRSLRSFSSSPTPCALWSWTPSMRRTLCPWPLSRDNAESTITRTCPVNPQPRGPPSMTLKRRGVRVTLLHPTYSINATNHHYRSMPHTQLQGYSAARALQLLHSSVSCVGVIFRLQERILILQLLFLLVSVACWVSVSIMKVSRDDHH